MEFNYTATVTEHAEGIKFVDFDISGSREPADNDEMVLAQMQREIERLKKERSH